MFPDIIELRDFYDSSLGQTARRLLRVRIRRFWPNVKGECVLGIGYATPFLRPLLEDAARVMALMPAPLGVHHWPPEGPNRTLIADEAEIPLPDLSVDKVLMVHAVESSEHLRAMLREAWRVLRPEGRLLVLSANRRGIWARLERTPFGHGRPFSQRQLRGLLADCMFTPEREETALYMPPVRRRWLLGVAPAVERVGSRWFRPLAGVVLIEARKTIYASTPEAGLERALARRRRLRVVPHAAPRIHARPPGPRRP